MSERGQIITFYSYKGGVGRSMALANVAALLGQWGYKTLIIDWDLEAPGLEHFFADYIDLDKTKNLRGIVDVLGAFFNSESNRDNLIDWKSLLVPILSPIFKTPIHLLTAGQRGDNYFKNVRNFDVEDFYSNKEGGNFIEFLRDQWKDSYDFILIDSRTGITDIGGICTIQLPDIFVALFTATEQSLQGTKNVIESALKGRQNLPIDRLNLVTIPIPSRFESDTEFELGKSWLRTFAKELSEVYADWLPRDVNVFNFLENTKLPYIPYFSFGEKLAVIEQGVKDPAGLGFAYETLAAIIANDFESVERVITNRADLVQNASIKPDIRSIKEESSTQLNLTPVVAEQFYSKALDLQKENQIEESIELMKSAVEIWKESLETDLIHIGPNLARAQQFLSDYYQKENDLTNSIIESRHSIDLYDRLNNFTLDNYDEDLAAELVNLSNLLFITNQFNEALDVLKQALSIYESLRNIDRNKYDPYVGRCLNLISEYLINLGKTQEALKYVTDSIEVFLALSQIYSNRFNGDLANSLNNFFDQLALVDIEQESKLLDLANTCIILSRDLAAKEPKRFEADYARNLNVVSDFILNKKNITPNEISEYLEMQSDAVNILRRLSNTSPSIPKFDLASSLLFLAKFQLKNEEYAKSFETVEEAFNIYSQLTESVAVRYKDEINEAKELIEILHKKIQT